MKKTITLFSVFILFHLALVANGEYPIQRSIGQLNSNSTNFTENPDTGLFLYHEDLNSDPFANQIDLFPDPSQKIKSNKHFTHRLDSIYFYYGNIDYDNPTQKTYYEYFQLGDSLRISTLSLSTTNEYYEVMYDANGNQVEYIYATIDVVNNVWLSGTKITRTFNANNWLLEIVWYIWNSSLESWMISAKIVQEFDESGYLTNRFYYLWNNDVNAWDYNYALEFQWVEINGSILLSSALRRNWDQEYSELENFYLQSYSYNDEGYRTLYLLQYWDLNSSAWKNNYKEDYTRNTDGWTILALGFNWDAANQNWLSASRNETEYDDYGNITHFSRYNWDSGLEIWRGTYRADSDFMNGNRINDYNFSWNEDSQDWRYSFWTEYIYYDIYAEKSTIVEMNEYYWNPESSGWSASYMQSYVYRPEINPENLLSASIYNTNKPNHVIEEEIRFGFGSTASFHRIYYYTEMENLTTVGNIDESNYNVFPNPAKDHLTIAGLQSTGHIMIYDMQGKLLLSEKVTGNEIVDISVLSPGLYLFRIVEEQTQIKTGKLIKY